MLNVPYVIHKDRNGNERAVDITTRLLSDRIVQVCGEITEELAESVTSQLLYLEAENKDKPITMIVNGPGGSCVAGLAIIDTMNTISCPVHTMVIGEVASMSAVIALSGTKGERKIMPHARYMLHSVASGVSGKVQDMKITLEETLKMQNMLMEMIAENCNKSVDVVKKDCDRDFWMSAEEAISYGCCDKIVEKHK